MMRMFSSTLGQAGLVSLLDLLRLLESIDTTASSSSNSAKLSQGQKRGNGELHLC